MSLVAAAAALAVAVLTAAPGDDDRHEVTLDASADALAGVPTVDELDGGDVLVVRVTDGEPGWQRLVRQCDRTVAGFSGCRNTFPVVFDDDGVATFQYQVTDPGQCGRTGSCALVIAESSGEPIAWASLVFGAAAPAPPDVSLDPRGPYRPGVPIDVDVRGLPAGAAVDVAVCGSRCDATESAEADDRGVAMVSVRAPDHCTGCQVVVLAGATSVRVPVRVVTPGVEYDPARLVAGLAAAAALIVAAWRIMSRVDWRPPSEAATPELDAADPRSVV